MKLSYTGTHGTGKTTAVYELATKMKIENPNKTVGIFMENAKHSPVGFNKNKPIEAQLWIFSNQLQSEIYLSTKYDILITDRTIFDPIAYTEYFGFQDLAHDMFKFALSHMNSYDKIMFRTIKNNNHWHSDGVRDTEDEEYRNKVEQILKKIYFSLLYNCKAKFEYLEV